MTKNPSDAAPSPSQQVTSPDSGAPAKAEPQPLSLSKAPDSVRAAWEAPSLFSPDPPLSPAQEQAEQQAEQRLIAGLLAIFLGSLGVHKFYLGLNGPGIILLGINLGVWFLAILFGLLLFGIGLLITIPFALIVSSLLVLLGLIEGVIILSRSDTEFAREYLVGKKSWF